MRPACLYLCLALTVLAGCVLSQETLTTTPFSMFLPNMSYAQQDNMTTEIKAYFSSIGSESDGILLSDGGGCVMIKGSWRSVNQTLISEIGEKLKMYGIPIMGQTWAVSFTGCAVETTLLRFKFYVLNITWSDAYKDQTSDEYKQLKLSINNSGSYMGGTSHAVEVAKNNRCLEVYVEWNAVNAANVMQFLLMMKKNGIVLSNVTYPVDTKPCQISSDNLDDCPEIPQGTIGTCIEGCNDNVTGRECEAGFKCCSNGCGVVCQRVGYAMLINVTIIVDLGGLENMNDSSRNQLQSVLKMEVLRNFNVEKINMISDVELTKISPYRASGQTWSILDAVLYFPMDVPNTDMKPGKARTMKRIVNIDSGSFRIIDLQLGSNSASLTSVCGGLACDGICKQLRSSIQYCSCEPGYSGPGCKTFECRPEMNLDSESNSTVCRNGGECVMDEKNHSYKCRCQPGFGGELCQVDLNSCPVQLARPAGMIGLCLDTCQTENCGPGQMCCKISCGKRCAEIGYYQKMDARIEFEMPFYEGLNDTNSPVFLSFKTPMEMWLNSVIGISGFQSVRVMSIQPNTNGQNVRRKREESNSVFNMEWLFTKEVPVDELIVFKDMLMANSNALSNGTWKVTKVSYDSEEPCPYMACDSGSICVTNFGGDVHCACPSSKTGPMCNVNKNIDVCAMGLCLNGGTCHNTADGGHYCDCPEGFSGSVCENAANHCPTGQPLMTVTGSERQCGRLAGACPLGFWCNVDPIDRWTACCYKTDALCELNPCSTGECVSDINSGSICSCPEGKQGLLCENNVNGTVALTACQIKQRFNDWAISVLQTGNSTFGVSSKDLSVILQHLGYQYISTDICDGQGNFKTVGQGVFVANPAAQRVQICIDEFGNYAPECEAAICDVLTNSAPMEFCLNGGRCVGDITRRICDCTGTGYHGVRCELSGDASHETDCTIRRDIAYMAIGILNGTVDIMPGMNMQYALTKDILRMYNTDSIFLPYCNAAGAYEYRGCLFKIEDISNKTCSCTDDDGFKVGNVESPFEPPLYCLKGSCPEEWGEDCQQPDWMCLENVSCQPYNERCAIFINCTDDSCKNQPEMRCAVKGPVLPCDLHPCKDDPFSMCQPCGTHGTCYNIESMNKSANMDYKCQCHMGFSGAECEINENICSLIASNFCESKCIGDVSNGLMCQCPPGFGGILCDKPVHSVCERREALFEDAVNILKGQFYSWNGYSLTDMQGVIKLIAQELDWNAIPVVKCTDNGFYTKVQCSVSVDNPYDEQCNCIDFDGKQISSNIKPYIGYDVCTAPSDPRELAQTACNIPEYLGMEQLQVCLNGGTCTFDIYSGKYCSCPVGYYGQFCQYQGNNSESIQPKSVCEFFADAFNTALEITTGHATWISSDLQKQLYLNLSYNFLQSQDNMSYALKAECNNDGTFKPASCYYNMKTGDRGLCYCMNKKGLIVEGEPVESPDSPVCAGRRDDTCPMVNCRYVCQHGYRINNVGCRTCACKNPCEEMKCSAGQRCVIQPSSDCVIDDRQMTCTKAVCIPVDKPGACPGYSPELYSSVPGGLLAAIRNNSCSVMCYDDTDCQGNMKCCGLCGNRCVQPEVSPSCQDYQMKMNAQNQFINMVRDELMTNRALTPADIRKLQIIADTKYYWIPSCDNSDMTRFQPLQCEQVRYSSSAQDVPICFCVDRYGNRVEGARANSSDPTSCDVKPFTCPHVITAHAASSCSDDLSCIGNEKCCDIKGNKVCAKPVDTSKLTTTLDQIMSNLCDNNADMCQGGSRCVKSWMDKGIACECSADRFGPFCEYSINGTMTAPRTACERKYLAFETFTQQLRQMNPSSSFWKLMDPFSQDKMMFDITSTVEYSCTADGKFAPKQCTVNAYDPKGVSPLECFCVSSDGMEILGTRSSDSVACGDNTQCPTNKNCSASVCDMAVQKNCNKNPCAMCMVYQCTCKPYFMDVNTGLTFMEAQCNYISLGVCEVQRCNIINEIEKSKYSLTDPGTAHDLPACDIRGSFQPQQCKNSNCRCVDQYGKTVPANSDGSCKDIDRVVKISMTAVYNADFNEFERNNKLQELKELLLEKLIDGGIDQRTIKKISEPYKGSGSIKMDVVLEDNPNSYNKDLALINEILEQWARSGALDLTVDGKTVPLASINNEITTESQMRNPGDEPPKEGYRDGLDRTEKIVIGVVCGVVGLLIIAVITYCLCCRNKEKKEALDDSFEHASIRKPTYDSPLSAYNHAYEDESKIKVKL